MTLELRVWAASIKDGWQVDRAKRPLRARAVSNQLRDELGGRWLLFYAFALQLDERREALRA